MFTLRFLNQFFVLFLVVTFVSCSKEVDEVNKVLLKEDLEASIYQDLKNEDSYLFQVSTIEQFNCGNSFIISNSKFENNSLDIVIEGVFIPNICEDSSRILNTIHHFNLSHSDPCRFSVNVQDLYKVEGSISKDPKTSDLDVTLSEAPRIRFKNYKLNHIGKDYIWLGIDLDEEMAHDFEVKFNNTIKSYLTEKQYIEDGNYGYFEIQNGLQKVYKGTSSTTYKSSYVFRLKDAIEGENHPIIAAIRALFKEDTELSNFDYQVMTGTGFEII